MFAYRVQTGSGTHPVSYVFGSGGPFLGGKAASAWSRLFISI